MTNLAGLFINQGTVKYGLSKSENNSIGIFLFVIYNFTTFRPLILVFVRCVHLNTFRTLSFISNLFTLPDSPVNSFMKLILLWRRKNKLVLIFEMHASAINLFNFFPPDLWVVYFIYKNLLSTSRKKKTQHKHRK